ncbi:amidohydrolase family protein [uncultured Devosia sp.]|uniref:amidohydrolase family protein n=1 Tax=uncultured Devosia sp. TaxID=211434 RepID=UPI002604E7EB|nr:amidohydrolase family protein [uncultured Devosia sp.]
MNVENRLALSRRGALGALGGAMALGLAGKAFAQATQSNASEAAEIVLRGGYVLSMDPALGDLETGDVHVRDGSIVEVAPEIAAPGALEIDARNTVVMPGFVDTHWHMWNSIWRGMANDASSYFALHGLAAHYTPQDHYIAVRYAALEALSAGFTTCHNWAHGADTIEDAEAELRALADTGIRAKMGLAGFLGGQPTTRDQVQAMLDWIASNGGGRIGLGMILDGAGEALSERVELARNLDLRPITDHGGSLAQPDLLGPEFLFTHGTAVTPEQIALILDKHLGVALCPGTDPMIGAGLPPIHALLAGGVPLDQISMTVDVTAQTPADPFAMLRTIVNAGRIQQANNPNLMSIVQAAPQWLLSYRDALAIGTRGGANVLGLGDQVGSLTPGKRADIIAVRTDALNMIPAANTNMTFQLVQHGLPSNVDTVIVDGHIRKQAGALVGVEVREILAEAAESQAAIRKRAGLPPLDTSL